MSDNSDQSNNKSWLNLLRLVLIWSHSNYAGKDPIAIVELSRKRLIRFKLAVCTVAATLMYLSVEFNSPTYSLLELSRGLLNHAENGKTLSQVEAPFRPALDTKTLVKSGTILLFFLIVYLQIVKRDHLSSNAYLQQLKTTKGGINKAPSLRRILFSSTFRDEAYFAQNMPSNNLGRLCGNCQRNSKCDVFIDSDADFTRQYSFALWRNVYYGGLIERRALIRLADTTETCRQFYYAKVSALNVAYISLAIFIAHRALEFLGRHSLNYPPLAIIMIIASAGTALLFSQISDPGKNSLTSGVWGDFKSAGMDATNSLSGHDPYQSAYKEIVCSTSQTKCRYVAPEEQQEYEIREKFTILLKQLVQHIDALITNKLASLIIKRHTASEIDHVRVVCEAIRVYFETAVADGGAYGCGRHADALYDDAYSEIRNRPTYVATLERQISERGFAIATRDTLPDGVQFAQNVGSIITVPVALSQLHEMRINARLKSSFRSKAPRWKPVVCGFVTVHAKSGNVFCPSLSSLYKALLNPFVHRIYFELTRDNLGGKRNSNEEHSQVG